jgi:membrane protein DedA with SNARE-associated domain
MDHLVDLLLNFSGVTPYVLVFVVLLVCGMGLPLPEDITLFAAGVISYYGSANVYIMIAVSFAGVMIGDCIMFALGAIYGNRITSLPYFQKILPPKRLDKIKKRIRIEGYKVIFAGRFMPGLRSPIFFSAGMLHLPFKIFVIVDGAAALISVPTIVYLVYHFGDQVDRIVRIIKDVQFGVIGLVVIVFAVLGTKIYFELRHTDETGE